MQMSTKKDYNTKLKNTSNKIFLLTFVLKENIYTYIIPRLNKQKLVNNLNKCQY